MIPGIGYVRQKETRFEAFLEMENLNKPDLYTTRNTAATQHDFHTRLPRWRLSDAQTEQELQSRTEYGQ